MPDFTIRPIRRADLHPLRDMITALAAHHGDTAELDLDTLNRDVFGAHPWVHVSVACAGSQVIGYYALCPLIKLQYGRRGMDMHHLYLHPDHRGHGIGRALIMDAIERARLLNCRYMMIGTMPDNTAAQEVYLACGFKRLARAPDRFYREIS